MPGCCRILGVRIRVAPRGSIDFFGDAANYALTLAVSGMAVRTRAKAAIFKAACMATFGVLVLGKAIWALRVGGPPEPIHNRSLSRH
jgi:hypothetical protein